MQEQLNNLAIVQHARLSGSLRELLDCHQREANQMQGAAENQTLILRVHGVVLADALRLRPATHCLEELALAYAESVTLENDRHCFDVDVSETFGRYGLGRVLVYHLQAQRCELGLVEESRLKHTRAINVSVRFLS